MLAFTAACYEQTQTQPEYQDKPAPDRIGPISNRKCRGGTSLGSSSRPRLAGSLDLSLVLPVSLALCIFIWPHLDLSNQPH